MSKLKTIPFSKLVDEIDRREAAPCFSEQAEQIIFYYWDSRGCKYYFPVILKWSTVTIIYHCLMTYKYNTLQARRYVGRRNSTEKTQKKYDDAKSAELEILESLNTKFKGIPYEWASTLNPKPRVWVP